MVRKTYMLHKRRMRQPPYESNDHPHLQKPINTRTTIWNQNSFIYCDVAVYGFVGDSAAQILRSVPVQATGNVVEYYSNICH